MDTLIDQDVVWRAADKTAPPEFTVNQLLSSFSWKMEEDILVPNHGCADIAPKSLLQLVACGYASQHHLVHDQVVVVRLSCTTYCWCKGDEQCANYNTISQQNTSMAETDEENEDAHEVAD